MGWEWCGECLTARERREYTRTCMENVLQRLRRARRCGVNRTQSRPAAPAGACGVVWRCCLSRPRVFRIIRSSVDTYLILSLRVRARRTLSAKVMSRSRGLCWFDDGRAGARASAWRTRWKTRRRLTPAPLRTLQCPQRTRPSSPSGSARPRSIAESISFFCYDLG